MNDRFRGLSKARIAVLASCEADVCVAVCKDVLFKGRDGNSSAARRVHAWAKREGYRITKPDNASADNAPSTAAVLEQAERAVNAKDK